jgi:cyclopropane fatty-acyl-phospholipid synthase-like methyltransferase
MKIKSTADVFELLGAYVPSATLGLALELGLFWKLAERARTADEVAKDLNIPINRCRYWLDIMVNLDLLDTNGDIYLPSELASTAILSTLSQDAWRNIANESRDSYPCLNNLPEYIHEPGSALAAQGTEQKNYFQRLKEDPERALRFTRMLNELHKPLANNLMEALDMGNVKRLMDLGGGSGIMSNALLSRNPDVTSVIVDIENVCIAGKDIVRGYATADRISYYPADFLTDDLPEGFDMILECDVCIYEEALFRKLQGCLNPGGRLVIVDQFAAEKGGIPPGRPLAWGFIGSLADPDFSFPTSSDIKELLAQTGYQIHGETKLPDHWLMINTIVPSS